MYLLTSCTNGSQTSTTNTETSTVTNTSSTAQTSTTETAKSGNDLMKAMNDMMDKTHAMQMTGDFHVDFANKRGYTAGSCRWS